MNPQVLGDFAQRFSLLQQVRAMYMSGKVAITEQKPVIIAKGRQLLHRVVGIVTNAPTMRVVNQSGKGIGDNIDVGRDM